MKGPASRPLSLQASAAGKMMLLGEYAVLEGAPALLEATQARAKVLLRRELGCGGEVRISGKNLKETVILQTDLSGRQHIPSTVPHVMKLAARIVATLGAQHPHALSGLVVDIDTTAFYQGATKLGLGSSAAVTAALLVGLFAVIDGGSAPSPRSPQRLWSEAQAMHHAHQKGVGSGADIAASLWGGRICFRRSRGRETCEVSRLPDLEEGASLFAVFSGKSADTPSFLTPFFDLKRSDPRAFWQLLEPLGALAQAGSEIWRLGKVSPLLPLWRAYQQALAQLGQALDTPIVTPVHQSLEQTVEGLAGAYKISGAGGGDIGLVLCPSRAVAERASRKLTQEGFRLLPSMGQARPAQVERVS